MGVVTQQILGGGVAPAVAALALVGVAVVAGRSGRPLLGELGVASGVVAGFVAGYMALVGAPQWPVSEAMQWLPWIALAGGGIALVDVGLRTLQGYALGLRVVGPAVAAWIVPALLFATLADNVWTAEQAARWQWSLSGGVVAGWLLLDLLAARMSSRGFAVLLGLLCAGAAGVIVLGQTAVLGQLVGGAAAAVGGAALLTVLGRTDLSLRAASLPVALIVTAAAASAHHYAYLSVRGLGLILAAPALAAVLVLIPWRWRPNLMKDALAVVAVIAVLGGAAAVAPQPEEAAPGSVEEELEFGYDSIDLESDSTPNPYENLPK